MVLAGDFRLSSLTTSWLDNCMTFHRTTTEILAGDTFAGSAITHVLVGAGNDEDTLKLIHILENGNLYVSSVGLVEDLDAAGIGYHQEPGAETARCVPASALIQGF